MFKSNLLLKNTEDYHFLYLWNILFITHNFKHLSINHFYANFSFQFRGENSGNLFHIDHGSWVREHPHSLYGHIFFESCECQQHKIAIYFKSLAFVQASPLNEPQVFLKYLSYCMPMLLEIFLPCYFGSEILTNSQELLTSIYHSNWTVTNKRYKTMMLIFVERTKKSLSVSAVRVVQLNLETFTRVNIAKQIWSKYWYNFCF